MNVITDIFIFAVAGLPILLLHTLIGIPTVASALLAPSSTLRRSKTLQSVTLQSFRFLKDQIEERLKGQVKFVDTVNLIELARGFLRVDASLSALLIHVPQEGLGEQ